MHETGAKAKASRRGGTPLPWVWAAFAPILVFVVLVAPNTVDRITPAAFLRIPVEAVAGLALLLALPGGAARWLARLAGVALGFLALIKIADMVSISALARPFDPVLDWHLLDAAMNLLTGAVGRAGAIGAATVAALSAVAVVGITMAATVRIGALVRSHRRSALIAVVALALAWAAAAATGQTIAPRMPVASMDATRLAFGRVTMVRESLKDRAIFAAEAAQDPYSGAPADRLLSALRGKDVVIAFIESYGRDALDNPLYAPAVGAVLADGEARLEARGFRMRSAWLTSPTVGGQSWLAHGTLLSGLWIANEQRYRTLVASDRLTLNALFRKAGWRSVAVMPAITMAWPEGRFFGYDHVWAAANLGYRGKPFNWVTMPDQYTLSAFERLERTAGRRTDVMAEIALISSHAPWTPIPTVIDWADVGDGTVFDEMAESGDPPEVVWQDPDRVRLQYRLSIEYALANLVSYLETYGDEDLVLIFLGDHQPAPLLTGEGASRDVPVTIVTRDPAVLARIDDWGWRSGLKPEADAPVWRMDAFRDRFLAAFETDGAAAADASD